MTTARTLIEPGEPLPHPTAAPLRPAVIRPSAAPRATISPTEPASVEANTGVGADSLRLTFKGCMSSDAHARRPTSGAQKPAGQVHRRQLRSGRGLNDGEPGPVSLNDVEARRSAPGSPSPINE